MLEEWTSSNNLLLDGQHRIGELWCEALRRHLDEIRCISSDLCGMMHRDRDTFLTSSKAAMQISDAVSQWYHRRRNLLAGIP
jgi:hypothetical protein